MTTREIVKNLRTPGKEPWLSSFRAVTFLILRKRGYSVQHIATAFNVNYYTVVRACDKAKGYIETKDVHTLHAMEVMNTHVIDLVPFFENDTKKVLTYAKIDNIKI